MGFLHLNACANLPQQDSIPKGNPHKIPPHLRNHADVDAKIYGIMQKYMKQCILMGNFFIQICVFMRKFASISVYLCGSLHQHVQTTLKNYTLCFVAEILHYVYKPSQTLKMSSHMFAICTDRQR